MGLVVCGGTARAKAHKPIRPYWPVKEHDGQWVTLPDDRGVMLDDADCLDALLCVLAAVDFVAGWTVSPSDLAKAQKEGWIRVRDTVAQSEQIVE